MAVDPQTESDIKKIKKKWKTGTGIKKPVTKIIKSKPKPKKVPTTEQLELLKIVKTPAFTIEEKFKVLDARDKLIRLRTKRQSDLSKAKVTIGTCQDMCPEKERLMREVQHQVAVYEQEVGGRGMNPKLAVKQYSRSSADQEVPLPHELRPVHVLQLTMNYLMHKIMDLSETPDVNIAEWYHFLWDRTRGIRKDITQQELCCLGSVELVEQCARFHIHCSARLVNEDPSVFDQKINTENLTKCLQSLKYMYHDLSLKGINCPHEAEFRAYVILLNLNDGNFMWEVQQLRSEIQKSFEVRFALQVYSAIDKNNYVKFFKLVHSTTYLNACILMRYFVQVRLKALSIILKSYSPRIPNTLFPLQELMKVLAFEDIPSTIEFLEYHGLKVNEDKSHVVLDRRSFYSPELQYTLERAVNVVESKRNCSVGETICGGTLPFPSFRDHQPHESFNSEGFVDVTDILSEFQEEELQSEILEKSEPDKMVEEQTKIIFGSTPPNQNIYTGNITGELRKSPSRTVFKSNWQQEGLNVFGKTRASTDVVDTREELKGSSWSNTKSSETLTVWPGNKSEPSETTSTGNIFCRQTTTLPSTKNIFGKPTSSVENIFGKPVDTISSTKSIFGSPKATEEKSFSLISQSNVFGGKDSKESIFQSFKVEGFPTSETKTTQGGFKFDLNVPEKKVINRAEEQLPLAQQSLESLEAHRLRIERELQEHEKLLLEKEAEARKKKEEEKRKLEQKELEERKRKEEERHRLEELRRLEVQRQMEEKLRKAEEERKVAQEKQRKEEENRRILEQKIAEQKRKEEIRRMQEITKTVKELMHDMLNTVEENIKKEKLQKIADHIKIWKLRIFFRKWLLKVVSTKRKRKIMEASPAWISFRSVNQEASELHTEMQDFTLNNIKRYKLGKSQELQVPKEMHINKINLIGLSQCLLKNYSRNDSKLHREIFWKVTISVPELRELKYKLGSVDDILHKYFDWKEDKYGNTSVITQTKVLNTTITFCFERRQGIRCFDSDTNGLLFIGKNINDFLISRVKESIKNFGNISIPVSIILLNETQNESELVKLKQILNEDKHVSQYNVTNVKLQPLNLVESVEQNLYILALFSNKPPPLQLNTLSSFLKENLCCNLWKYVASYAKWNNLYKQCLKKPNVVIKLYNEGIDRIKEIVNSNNNREYCSFPEEFQDYLRNKIPDVLPCDYKYFPKFWSKDEFLLLVISEIDSLKLPNYEQSWPPSNELQLEKNIFDYCCMISPKSSDLFYKIMASILKNFDPNENFEKIRNVSWLDIIEVIAGEKVDNANFSLRNTEFYSKSIFNQLFVVYNVEELERFSKEPWFYVTNPVIASEMKQISKMSPNKTCKRAKRRDEMKQQIYIGKTDFDKTMKEVMEKSFDEEDDILRTKTTLKNLEFLMSDLEESMLVQKKISEKFQATVKSVLMDI